MGKRVGVVLSGCGFLDGAEIQEAVLTLLALAKAGARAVCAAPDIPQADVVNHVSSQPQTGEGRSVLVESARICRGDIRPLSQLTAEDLDALVLPGGYGAAKNLSDFATKGADCSVNSDLKRLLQSMHAAGKPIGLICIAPAVGAKVLGGVEPRLRLTIGNDPDTAKAIEAMGAQHVQCAVDDVVADEANRVVSTPAYMLAKSAAEVDAGVGKLVARMLELCAART